MALKEDEIHSAKAARETIRNVRKSGPKKRRSFAIGSLNGFPVVLVTNSPKPA